MRFLTGQPAALIGDSLIIADVHLGIAHELADAGIHIPSQVGPLVERIEQLKKATKAKNLIILGDVKHAVPGISLREQREIPLLLSKLARAFERIIIVKGNHDGRLERLIPHRQKIKVRKHFLLEGHFLTHGHRRIKGSQLRTASKIIIGHSHPHLEFRDKLGARYTEPIWVRGHLNTRHELVIVPAFNSLCGATLINRDGLLGPVAKKLASAHTFLLDGTDLGSYTFRKL